IATSQLEASGAVGSAAVGNTLRAVDLLFNAGISLRAQKEVSNGEMDDVLLRARLLINAAGLNLALTARENLYEALEELDGVDCAINYIDAFVNYRSTGDVNTVASVSPLAGEIAYLAKWPLLQTAKRKADLARLERSANALGIMVEVRSSFPGLAPSAQQAIAALRDSFGFESRESGDPVVDTAAVVGNLYSSVL